MTAPLRQRALVPEDKAARVYNFHRNSPQALAALTGAAGLSHPGELESRHIVRRISGHEIRLVANLYTFLKPRELFVNPKAHAVYEYYWPLASSHSFDRILAETIRLNRWNSIAPGCGHKGWLRHQRVSCLP